MLRRIVSGITIAFLLLASLAALAFYIQPAKTSPTTIVVPDDYLTIQEAINNANEGDTIFVRNRTYNENLIVNKPVSLIGENRETTIINGNNLRNSVEVTASNVAITNFTIKSSGWGSPNNGMLLNHTNNCDISGNKLIGNDNGIRLSNSSNNAITGNNVTDNDVGIAAWDSSKYNSISGNYVANSTIGIWLYESPDNSVYENEITKNNYGIRVCYCALNNKIYHNNIIDNIDQAYSWNSTSTWDNGYPSGGNYWSDYSGVDIRCGEHQSLTGSDGIGDTNYIIDLNKFDRYPFKEPNGWENYPIPIESNITIAHKIVRRTEIYFTASGEIGQIGYVNATVPVGFNTTEIKVLVDNQLIEPPFPIVTISGTHYFVYIEFTLSTHDIKLLFTKIGDFGGGSPPDFFNFDNKVDGIDLALFIQCYKNLAPAEVMYLGDLGGGLPPQFRNYDGKADGIDLALFIECYKGRGPDT